MRFADTIFCDDVRYEVGNKASYMGVYGEDVRVPEFPYTFTKICIVVNAKTDAEDPFQSLVFRIYINGEEQEFEIPEDDLKVQQQNGLFDDEDDNDIELDGDVTRTLNFLVRAAFRNVKIEQQGRIKVRVETERETLRAGTLLIRKSEQEF